MAAVLGGFMPLARMDAVQLLAQADGGGFPMWPSLIVIFGLFCLMLIRPERRKQREHQEKLSKIKKNDRVVTIGGIYGVVTNVLRDADEVTLRVDEGNNTKIRVTLAAINRVLTEDESDAKEKVQEKN